LASGKLLKDPTNPTYTLYGNVNANAARLKTFPANISEVDSLNNADLVRGDIVKSTLNGGII